MSRTPRRPSHGRDNAGVSRRTFLRTGDAQYSHLYGWPAPPDERIQLITNSYIIPTMFARVVTNSAKPKEAILWAETEIRRASAS